MNCPTCTKQFNPHDNAEVGDHDGDAVELRTSCPHCKQKLMTFVEPSEWVEDGEAPL